MTFTNKNISYKIEPADGSPVISLAGLRSSCQIIFAGKDNPGVAEAAIFGMRLSEMNALTKIGRTRE